MGHEERSDFEIEGAKFLERDFNQCFEQMRHYDDKIWDICKFAFTGYTALLGIAIGLRQYAVEKSVDLTPAVVAVLTAGLIIGLFMYCLTIRNRVYFVAVTRYINEHRGFYLKNKPLGFENLSLMYKNPLQPPYWNWRSSQLWLSYIIAFLNSILCSTLVVFLAVTFLWIPAVSGAIVFSAQLVIGAQYLRRREGKSVSQAVHGKSSPE